ncbi:carcinoembryonic antigen-related cell adhesion molecule 5-like [Brachionichthys hirsutus]|uniref:carcinoembryonic antigen-related cell adhesion molecule 5-like n=1 Tax=Brachionichthys hirsutus TaxID=412623 RepID=UPI003604D4B8
MESPAVFVLILATISFEAAPAHTQTLLVSENPLPVGSQVTLYDKATVSTGAWIFENQFIVLIVPGQEIITNSYSNRVTLNTTANFTSLTIKSLTVEDSGMYTLQGLNSFSANAMLSVQEPVSDVTLKAKATNLVEYNDTAVLMCSVSNGTSLSYVWMNNSLAITASERIQFSDKGASLTIDKVTRYDGGPFRCNVSNAVSGGISPPVNLNISYGPSNTTLMIMPMKYTHKAGSNITLSCSTDSKPQATIKWMVDGMALDHSDSTLHLKSVTENDMGKYECIFHNAVTLRFDSANAMIKIEDPITAVVVKDKGKPAIVDKSFTMYCDATGSVGKVHWWKNGHNISSDNTTVFDMNKKTLTLNPVQVSDKGNYQCQAYNNVSSMTSDPYTLEVYYGPMKPTIMGPKYVKVGDNVTLSCNASSNPPSTYKWYFNGSMLADMSKYVTPPFTRNMSGKYTCMAFNNITGENSTVYKFLSVVDPITAVKIEAPMKHPVEGYSYYLTCNVTGPAEYVYWMKNGERLYGDDRKTMHMDNNTLKFYPVEYNDTGYYQCVATNVAWNKTSPAYKLLVYFGPKKPFIHGLGYAEKGKFAHFYCLAESLPLSYYSWWYNGSEVASTSLLVIGPLSYNMSGEYTCVAYNNVTGKNSTYSKMLTVIEAIESVMVKTDTVPIEFKDFTLICEVIGPYDKIYWMMDDMPLNHSYYYNYMYHNYTHHNYNYNYTYHNYNYTHHNYNYNYTYYNYNYNDNTTYTDMSYHTLKFTPVTKYNNGKYQCVATNRAGHHASAPYMLLVNYGPLNVTITRSDALFGLVTSLVCLADSHPECDFYWFLNNHTSPRETGSTISFPLIGNNEGNYTCKATNPVTGITMYQTKAVGHASALYTPFHGSLMLMGVFALSFTVLFN